MVQQALLCPEDNVKDFYMDRCLVQRIAASLQSEGAALAAGTLDAVWIRVGTD